jgi:hypothetical protein
MHLCILLKNTFKNKKLPTKMVYLNFILLFITILYVVCMLCMFAFNVQDTNL